MYVFFKAQPSTCCLSAINIEDYSTFLLFCQVLFLLSRCWLFSACSGLRNAQIPALISLTFIGSLYIRLSHWLYWSLLLVNYWPLISLICSFLYLWWFNNIIITATTPPPCHVSQCLLCSYVAMQHGTVFAYARIMPGLCRLCCSAVYGAMLHHSRPT
jgi:hypothetical protein